MQVHNSSACVCTVLYRSVARSKRIRERERGSTLLVFQPRARIRGSAHASPHSVAARELSSFCCCCCCSEASLLAWFICAWPRLILLVLFLIEEYHFSKRKLARVCIVEWINFAQLIVTFFDFSKRQRSFVIRHILVVWKIVFYFTFSIV